MAQVFRADDDIRALWTALTGDGLIGVMGPRPQVQARLALIKAIVQAEDLADRYRICAYPWSAQSTMGVAYDPRRYRRDQARLALDRRLTEPAGAGREAASEQLPGWRRAGHTHG